MTKRSMRMSTAHLAAILGLCLAAWVTPVPAQEQPPTAAADRQPVRVTADAMEVKTAQNLIVFSGNVVVTRGNITLRADRARIAAAGEQGRKIEEMEAEGNVRVDQVIPEEKVERHATGRKAVYREKDGRVVLTGDPKAWEKENIITGDTMTFHTLDNLFLVDGKVKIIFYPDERMEKGDAPGRK